MIIHHSTVHLHKMLHQWLWFSNRNHISVNLKLFVLLQWIIYINLIYAIVLSFVEHQILWVSLLNQTLKTWQPFVLARQRSMNLQDLKTVCTCYTNTKFNADEYKRNHRTVGTMNEILLNTYYLVPMQMNKIPLWFRIHWCSISR